MLIGKRQRKHTVDGLWSSRYQRQQAVVVYETYAESMLRHGDASKFSGGAKPLVSLIVPIQSFVKPQLIRGKLYAFMARRISSISDSARTRVDRLARSSMAFTICGGLERPRSLR